MTDRQPAAPRATVLVCTYDRARLLGETLEAMGELDPPPGGWELVVVDNGSPDDTADLIRRRAAGFPVRLRYLHEPRQGKSHALNTGLAAISTDLVVFTDDDVRVPRTWLRATCEAFDEDPTIDYVGGPVRPIWGAEPPAWFPKVNGNLWGTIAVLDYGTERFVFEDRGVVPIGANMAVRRSVIDRIGGFDAQFGRAGRSLLGQEQAEFFCRTRRAGIRGLYVPRMELEHHVPAVRLTRRYFRRWWYWKGISRARLHRAHPESKPPVASKRFNMINGVTRGILGEAARRTIGFAIESARNPTRAAEHEMMLAYLAGYVLESRRAASLARSE